MQRTPHGVCVQSPREPIFNVPSVVLVILALLVAVHGMRALLLTEQDDQLFLLSFGFLPVRYDTAVLDGVLPGGTGAQIWTFITYALLHADLTHIGFNAIWLVAFGSPVARRFGALRFMLFCVATVVAGALAHLALHAGERNLMVGASAAISGMMGAATRFAFQQGGSLDFWRDPSRDPDRVPAAPLLVALRNSRVVAFLAVWFGLNLLFGLGSISLGGAEQSVAWEAHLGGFLVGLLLFSAFDPIPPADQSVMPTLH